MVETREPYVKGQFIVWLTKDKEHSKDQIQEICDNCDVKLLSYHGPERCCVGFDEEKANEVMEKLYAWPEYIRNVSRNHYVYLEQGLNQ